MRREANVISGWFAASKKSDERRWSSRSGVPVSMLATSTDPDAITSSPPPCTTRPLKDAKRPFTARPRLLTRKPTSDSSLTRQEPSGTRGSPTAGGETVGEVDIKTAPFLGGHDPVDSSMLAMIDFYQALLSATIL